jgi:sugar lactone lactonase YvrE
MLPEVFMRTMRTAKCTILLLAATALMAAGASQAAPNLIGSIHDDVSSPTRVAVDGQGSVYVSETDAGIVNKYDGTGTKIASFAVPRPFGIAVSAAGNIYVCSVQGPSRRNNYVNSSAVYILTPALVQAGTLGAAQGEFSAPVDIAIDGAGALYVSDMAQGLVKVFNASGVYQYSIGSGYLRPGWTQGVAVNDGANNGAGEVYVVDTAPSDVQGYPVDGPRISVFTKNGSLLRAFGQFGTETGSMVSPHGIALDRDGLLYTADSGGNVVHVMNAADGTPVGDGGLYASGVFLPGGVAVTRSNVAYVAWQSGGRVDLFGLPGYTAMQASPGSLSFAARQYGSSPDAQTVTIANSGSGILNWSAAADRTWIILGDRLATGSAGTTGLSVGIDLSALVPGDYTGTITVASEFGEHSSIKVDLAVAAPLVLSISNGSPAFAVKQGGADVSGSITIGIDGGAGTWSIAPAALPSWLSVAPLNGGSDATTVTLTVSAAGLQPRSAAYVAEIPVSAPGVVGDGGKITVSLTVAASTTINVSTNRSDATFRISGPADFSGSGKSWSVGDAPAGDYTVTFGALAGFRTPVPQTRTLAENGAVSFQGTYLSNQDLAARRNIIAAKGPGAGDDATIRLFRNNGSPVAFDLLALETLSGANIAAGDVDGDGTAELIVGAGAGAGNPAKVRIFRTSTKEMLAEFIPFGTLNGAGVAAADLNGDGKAEIIVNDNAGTIAVYTQVNGTWTASGIAIAGSTAAAADTAGDGRPEIVAATATGLKVWALDTSAAVGSWSRTLIGDLPVIAAALAAADTDGDGQEEIVAGIDGRANSPSSVVILEMNGGSRSFPTFDKYGIAVAAADLDGDGRAEIIAGAGARKTAAPKGKMSKMEHRGDGIANGNADHENGTIRVYGADGALKFSVKAFDDAADGTTIAVGELGQ